MGVTAAAHLPHVTSSSYPSLQAHLQAAHQAVRVSSWSLSIRLLRSTLDDDKSRRGQVEGEGENGASQTPEQGAARRTKLMYQVTISDFPNDVFVLVEDPERPTRATLLNEARSSHAGLLAKNGGVGLNTEIPNAPVVGEDGKAEVKDEAATAAVKAAPEAENGASGEIVVVGDQPSDVEMSDAPVQGMSKEENGTATEPTPTTRFTLFAAASSFPMLLTSLNLPPALGAPSLGDGVSSTSPSAGPGAWMQRGAALVVEGATWELPSMEGSLASENRGEWKIRLGLVMHGGTRSAGALLEAEYLPLNALPPTSPLLTSQLRSIFPAYLLAPTNSAGVVPSDTLSATQPSADLWSEVVVPPEGEAQELPNSQRKDPGWIGTERGRRLAFMYINLLRAQGII
ncbi:hypothetical protein FA10DRAFT_299565 [Acaromyces ingoldii]|uniref:Mediator complex subunit 20 n=1 Tax=Acaromyces ingoldii TaxID=215250 RepID=A0A316Z021_9BASI|nr:hypothetical protein FA10DRAFT_299565 [Acaromyces ingoldii]PWN94268.1 hypothetical protein FA10DRAFT_299565 [Acaromyces ingoldii]